MDGKQWTVNGIVYCLLLAAAIEALPVQIQAVMVDLEMEQITHCRLDLLDARIAELNYFPAIDADEMIVLLKAVGLLVLCEIFSKLVLRDEIAIHQQLKRIINGGAAHAVV